METKTIYKITNPSREDWAAITHFIKEYKLDDTCMYANQFIVCREGETLLGFGRIKKHKDCDELSSLGVLPECRKKGIGKIVVNELIKRATQKLFLVTVIPDYFSKLGFEKTTQFPAVITAKQHDCKLVCGCELPTVMVYTK